MSNTSEEFAVIEPASDEMTVAGRLLKLRPVTVTKLPAFARAVRPVLAPLGALLERVQELQASGGQINGLELGLDLVADHGEQLIEIIRVATGLNAAELDTVDPVEFVELTVKVVRVNADFFARRLQPILAQALTKASASNPGDGQTPSSV